MTLPISKGRTMAAALWAFLVVGGTAFGQLDLPRRRAPEAPATPRVLPEPPPRGDLAPNDPREQDPALALPEHRSIPRAPDTEALPPAEVAARSVFEALARERSPSEGVIEDGTAELRRIGPGALPAARSALEETRAGPLLAAAGFLLEFGSDPDRALVAERLRRTPLPASCAQPILDALLAADPVLCDPRYLASLLDAKSSAVRACASKALLERLTPALLPALVDELGASSSRTRGLVLDIVRRIPGEEAERVLIASLADRSAEVARAASRELALRDPARVVPALRATVFSRSDGLNRAGAYALLSLVEREDRDGIELLGEQDVPFLLDALASPKPLIAGAAAIALAGIGVRASASLDTPWLDAEVPHTLVRLATGDVFFADFTSIEGPGVRRLGLLTGQSLPGGAAWQAWWVEHAPSFRAHRAVLPLLPGDEGRLEVRLVEGGEEIRLVGPELAREHAADPSPPLFLDREQARALAGRLQAAGVFGPERPSAGPLPARADLLEVRVGEREKTIAAPVAEAAWYREVVDAVHRAAVETRWEHWFDPGAYRDAFEAWIAERTVVAELSTSERRTFLARRVLARLRRMRPKERDRGVSLLVELQADGAALSSEELGPLLELLEGEAGFGVRARELTRLASNLARNDSDRERLVDSLATNFGFQALDEVVRILSGADRELVERLAAREGAEGAVARAAGAHVLGARLAEREGGNEGIGEARARFLALFEDPDARVRVEAARVAGRKGLGFAEEALGRLAAVEEVPVRAAALRALGTLGAASARGLSILALSEEEGRLTAAAAETLADLAEKPAADRVSGGEVSLLISLFAAGPESPGFRGARRGLAALGEAAWTELLRLLAHPDRAVRREAALLLAEQGRAEAASTLLVLLTEDPDDRRVAEELAILTCFEPDGDDDPIAAWWEWWDGVTHEDAMEWFRAACARSGHPVPPVEAIGGAGSAEGALALLGLAWDRAVGHSLATRARRELARLLDEEIPPPPADPAEREQERERIRLAITSRFPPR